MATTTPSLSGNLSLQETTINATVVLSNVRAVVNGERLPHSLLGISALERLSGYEVRDGTLTLRP